MTNSTTYNARNMVATNGAEFTEATDRLVAKHQAEIDAFMAEHGAELYEKQDRDERMMVYGAEYFVEVGGDFDEDGEFDVAATIEANDMTTDDMDYIESHGIYQMADHTCYREIGTADQRELAPHMVNMETRAVTVACAKAQRAQQLVDHLAKPVLSRGQQVVAAKTKTRTGDAASRDERALKRMNRQRKRMGLEPLAALPEADKRPTPRFTDAESNAARAERAAEKRLDDHLNQ